MSLLAQFDELRTAAYAALDSDRSALGQYYTPEPIATLLASMLPNKCSKAVSLLDPGAGVGMLSAAAVMRLETLGVEEIKLTVCEVAPQVLPFLRKGMSALKTWCKNRGVRLSVTIVETDFVVWAVEQSSEGELFSPEPQRFDFAILNPPYKKMNTQSVHRHLLRRAGLECTNIYAGFVFLAAKCLREGGHLISINPRSFANGPYFRDFRQRLFTMTSLCAVHLFNRRNQAFAADKVLQENVVMHVVRSGARLRTVHVYSSSAGESSTHVRSVPLSRVIRDDDPDKVVHLETTNTDTEITDLIRAQPATLREVGVQVSTGKVVDFRAREALSYEDANDALPLVYPHHLREAAIVWPRRTKKPDYFRPQKKHTNVLVPAGTYVLTKRFTSKEEKRRIVASLLTPRMLPGRHYAFENHLNYFHASGEPLDEEIARGLTAYLNSTAVDHYFRLYNGHTQVNATDLRALRYPSATVLREVGQRLAESKLTTKDVDSVITEILHSHAQNQSQRSNSNSSRSRSSTRAA